MIDEWLDWTARRSSTIFYALLCALVSWNSIPLFFGHRKVKRNHASTGLIYLILLSLGFADCMGVLRLDTTARFYFDVSLGLAGIILTLTAASDFSHKHVTNVASGTLDEHATVTYGEMIEHSFYQLLNLVQVVYLHAISAQQPLFDDAWWAPLLLLAATLPWAVRSRFPINRFSDNYNKLDPHSSSLIRLLYRIKKYQYVFYKACLLHGLNVSVALRGGPPINPSSSEPFRLYWVLLNTAYVMEFFLQTLVKKGRLSQNSMLFLNALLMLASTCAALPVLGAVLLPAAALSLVLNFSCRGADVPCTLLVFFLLKTHVYL